MIKASITCKMFLFSPNSYIDTLIPNMVAIGSGGFERELSLNEVMSIVPS